MIALGVGGLILYQPLFLIECVSAISGLLTIHFHLLFQFYLTSKHLVVSRKNKRPKDRLLEEKPDKQQDQPQQDQQHYEMGAVLVVPPCGIDAPGFSSDIASTKMMASKEVTTTVIIGINRD